MCTHENSSNRFRTTITDPILISKKKGNEYKILNLRPIWTNLTSLKLKPKLSKEPPVLTSLEPLLEPLLGLLARGDLLVTCGERIGCDHILQIHIERVAGRHEVGEVDDLEKRLHARLLGCLLGGILANHLLWVFRQTRDEAVAVRTVAIASFENLDDDRLSSGVAAVEHDHRLVRLEELHHGAAVEWSWGREKSGGIRF
ncbi:Leucyl/phenylalanyl-tRNA--protein transferase [Rhynchospora pubera]|uniref:Leucyl/phenylalanyl-tRNA--protein transferase n=1 Tax=Rhynchospora pubera TaxID=906938 RepID=A0AAV8D938_9POAL|nr:Leucyl/phenylalanyl-tRNA--protein transferase [Rhynchospora pubera]